MTVRRRRRRRRMGMFVTRFVVISFFLFPTMSAATEGVKIHHLTSPVTIELPCGARVRLDFSIKPSFHEVGPDGKSMVPVYGIDLPAHWTANLPDAASQSSSAASEEPSVLAPKQHHHSDDKKNDAVTTTGEKPSRPLRSSAAVVGINPTRDMGLWEIVRTPYKVSIPNVKSPTLPLIFYSTGVSLTIQFLKLCMFNPTDFSGLVSDTYQWVSGRYGPGVTYEASVIRRYYALSREKQAAFIYQQWETGMGVVAAIALFYHYSGDRHGLLGEWSGSTMVFDLSSIERPWGTKVDPGRPVEASGAIAKGMDMARRWKEAGCRQPPVEWNHAEGKWKICRGIKGCECLRCR
jgi:hypothetical protein